MSIGLSDIKEKDQERERIAREIAEYQAKGGRIRQLDLEKSIDGLDSWRKMGEVTYRNRKQRKAAERKGIRPMRRD